MTARDLVETYLNEYASPPQDLAGNLRKLGSSYRNYQVGGYANSPARQAVEPPPKDAEWDGEANHLLRVPSAKVSEVEHLLQQNGLEPTDDFSVEHVGEPHAIFSFANTLVKNLAKQVIVKAFGYEIKNNEPGWESFS